MGMSYLSLGTCIGLFLAAAVYMQTGPSPYYASLAVYAAWGLSFVSLEMGAVADRTNWNTLSWTAWQLQSRSGLFSLAFAAGLFVLLLHIVLPGRWPAGRERQGPEGKN